MLVATDDACLVLLDASTGQPAAGRGPLRPKNASKSLCLEALDDRGVPLWVARDLAKMIADGDTSSPLGSPLAGKGSGGSGSAAGGKASRSGGGGSGGQRLRPSPSGGRKVRDDGWDDLMDEEPDPLEGVRLQLLLVWVFLCGALRVATARSRISRARNARCCLATREG